MALFRTRPVEIEATQFLKLGDHPAVRQVRDVAGAVFIVEGVQGVVQVMPGDSIITEPRGEGYYPCGPLEFKDKYEPIEERQPAGFAERHGRLTMIWRLLHRWFGWHDYIWESPEDEHDTCWICGATREREFG